MTDEDTTVLVHESKKHSKAAVVKQKPPSLPPFRPMKSTGVSAPVAAQAAATATSAPMFAALKAAYKWTDKTKLTRVEFLQKRAAWLSRPANEVK